MREPVYLWAKEWDGAQVGIWEEVGSTSLSFLEYLLIGVAGEVSTKLLNREGLSRSSSDLEHEHEKWTGTILCSIRGGGNC